MRLSWQRVALPLRDPFTIARGTLRHQSALLVSLAEGDTTGYGEAMCNAYYRHTYESLEGSLSRVATVLEKQQLSSPEDLYDLCRTIIPDDPFALSAVDCACHDLFGKVHGLTTRSRFHFRSEVIPHSSYTLGIDSIPEMIRKLEQQPNWPIYKIKLGTPHDLDIVTSLRRHTDAIIRVDANCAWTASQAVEMSFHLRDLGVEFIEQPLPYDRPRDEFVQVYENSVLPVIADESCRSEADVENCHGVFHGINLKLVKCGGLTPTVRMLRRARELGIKTMVGCMIESSVGISAAAQLLPGLDYADLDGAALLAEDPASGVTVIDGTVRFPAHSGNGVVIDSSLEKFGLDHRAP